MVLYNTRVFLKLKSNQIKHYQGFNFSSLRLPISVEPQLGSVSFTRAWWGASGRAQLCFNFFADIWRCESVPNGMQNMPNAKFAIPSTRYTIPITEYIPTTKNTKKA